MRIGTVASDWARIAEVEALLEPARIRGGLSEAIGRNELVWIVLDGDELIGAATTWLGDEWAEVALVGGRNHRRWIGELDRMIGAAARHNGVSELRAYGRRGWRRVLTNWDVAGERDGFTVYRREV